jgi:anti-sigma factor RsiW
MIACPDRRDQLLDSALGVLGASAVSELAMHLAACSACAAALADLRARREQLDAGLAALVGGVEPSPDFRARVLAAVEREPSQPWAAPAWAGALAALLFVVLAAGALYRSSAPSQTFGTRAPSLTDWRSPTESLLRAPASSLLNSAPRLGETYFPLPCTRSESNSGGNHES